MCGYACIQILIRACVPVQIDTECGYFDCQSGCHGIGAESVLVSVLETSIRCNGEVIDMTERMVIPAGREAHNYILPAPKCMNPRPILTEVARHCCHLSGNTKSLPMCRAFRCTMKWQLMSARNSMRPTGSRHSVFNKGGFPRILRTSRLARWAGTNFAQLQSFFAFRQHWRCTRKNNC